MLRNILSASEKENGIFNGRSNVNSRFYLLIILCLLFSTSCERSVDWEIQDVENPKLVVEAILTNEIDIQVINLSTSFTELNGASAPITNARVTVEANNVVYSFVPDGMNVGRYISRDSFAALAGLDYQLNINWSGEDYSAFSRLSTVAAIPDINFNPLGQQDSVFIDNNVVPLFNATQQAMYQFDIDWSHLQIEGMNKARMFYYTFNTVHNSQFIRPKTERIAFPIGSVVVIKKYGLSEEFGQFLRAQVIETDWNGAIIYGNPENAPSNISNNGLGFFASCAVLRDTVLAE